MSSPASLAGASPDRTTGLASPAPATGVRCDPDSRAWLDAPGGEGPTRDLATARLHALLLRAAAPAASARGPTSSGYSRPR